MIYICTVHFETERWISRQSAFMRRNIDREYRVLACVPRQRRRRSFYLESTYEPSSKGSLKKGSFNHAEKLNYLASIVTAEAKPDDIIIFLDGDAFPVRPLGTYLDDKLARHPLIAVQRLENAGDIQPHPSFAATTVGFWNEIAGDWSPGFEWLDRDGHAVTDTGGNLLQKLESYKVDWHPMLRSNRLNPHPLWFGVYDDIIYHHGAGYRRRPVSRVDVWRTNISRDQYFRTREYRHIQRMHRRVFRCMLFNSGFYRAFL